MIDERQICIITQQFEPNSQAIAVRMKYIAEAFQRKGFKVSIITKPESSINAAHKYEIQSIWSPMGSNKDRVFVRLLKEIVTSIELFMRVLFSKKKQYFITSPPFIPAALAALACNLRGSTYIFDVRDEYPAVYFSQGLLKSEGLLANRLKKLERYVYNHAEIVTTVTETLVNKIKSRCKDPNKCELLRNGYTDQIIRMEKPPTEPFNIVFHGNMGQFLNPQLIIDVAYRCLKRNLQVQFLIYGWGAQMQAIIKSASKIENLHFMGTFEHESINEILKNTTLGIAFQGDTEMSVHAFPVKVAEYLGAGIPVLITPKGEAGEFLEAHKVGYQFSNLDQEEIVNTIERLKINKDELYALSQNTKVLEQILSRRQICDRFVDQLMEIC